jgi:hypothetical protein
MDTEIQQTKLSLAQFIGQILGLVTIGVFAASVGAGVLYVAWNACVPQVFAGREVTLSQSFAMVAVAWVVTARIR